jgi:hypothetical protein
LKLSGYTRILPYGFRNYVLKLIDEAEQQYGRPVFAREVFHVFQHRRSIYLKQFYVLFLALLDLYANDELLACPTCDRWSVNPKNQRSEQNPDSEFELFSDRHVRKWPHYHYDAKGVIRPSKQCEVINFEKFRNLILADRTPENEHAAE